MSELNKSQKITFTMFEFGKHKLKGRIRVGLEVVENPRLIQYSDMSTCWTESDL